MSYRIGVKPSKPASLVGMIAGGLFVMIGVAAIIPVFGLFGMVWTLFAVCITLFYAFNFFSQKGVATYEVDVAPNGAAADLDSSLRDLTKLKNDGFLSEEEFQQKRAELMRSKG